MALGSEERSFWFTLAEPYNCDHICLFSKQLIRPHKWLFWLAQKDIRTTWVTNKSCPFYGAPIEASSYLTFIRTLITVSSSLLPCCARLGRQRIIGSNDAGWVSYLPSGYLEDNKFLSREQLSSWTPAVNLNERNSVKRKHELLSKDES